MESTRMEAVFTEAPEELVASDDDTDDYKHAKLLQAIGNLHGKKRTVEIQRSEPAGKASEFHLAPGTGKVDLGDLMGALRRSGGHGDVKKQLSRVHTKQKLLNTPLPKNEIEKMQRSLAYESSTVEVAKWDPIVKKNRKAEQLEFPLVRPSVQLRTTKQMSKGHQPRTPLEIEVAKLLAGSQNVGSMKKELTAAEERALQAMSIEEAKERRAELQKYRALLSYKEAKARRQKKIKSKKFHRILRKEKEKTDKKQLDNLEQKDPEAYADMLMKLQKDRIQERMSLKHRGASKFMKRQQIYGKFNDKARQSFADMLEKSKELREKVGGESASSSDGEKDGDEDSEDEDGPAPRFTPTGLSAGAAAANPWMASAKPETRHARPEAMVNIHKEQDEQESDSEEEEEEGEDNGDEQKGAADGEVSQEGTEKGDGKGKGKQTEVTDLGIDDIFLDAQRKLKKNAQARKAIEAEEAEIAREKRRLWKAKEKQKAKEKAKRRKRKKGESSSSESESDSDSESEQLMSRRNKDSADTEQLELDPSEQGLSASLKRKQTLEDFNAEWSGDEQEARSSQSLAGSAAGKTNSGTTEQKRTGSELQVDPKKYLTVSTRMESSLDPTLIEGMGEEEDDMEDQQRLTIAQAFAQDDVVEEFKADKLAAIDRDKPKDIDLTLPGWGDWGGTGVSVSRRKKRRFIIKAPPTGPRKDKDLKGVIISETKDNTIAKHQVKRIPFPFTSVNQFEASVRAPVGKTWNPENAYRKLIQPKIVTKMGTVIEPMDKAQVFKKQNKLPANETPDTGAQGKKTKKGGNQQKRKKKKSQ